MPRRARLSLPGIPWHIIQRSNNRATCFFSEEDYRLYLDHLSELSERFEDLHLLSAGLFWPSTR